MAKFTKELAKLFRKITNSEIDAEGNAHVVLSPADSLLINNARIALASLEAEAVACIDRANLDYLESGADADVWPASGAGSDDVLLYAAPQLPQPAVLSVPDEIPKLKDGMGFKYVKDGVRYSLNYANGWNACRAAMLQAEPASNSDELPPDYLQGHKDGLEWAAQLAEANHPQTGDWLYDDPIELARAIRKGPDMPTVQDGKSPVAPGAWIPVSERMPEAEGRYWCYVEEQNCLGKSHYQWNCSWNGERWWVESDNGGRVTHWMELPAAPQQDVKSALEHGMQRYAGAMQKLSEGDD
ncbi:DUF551 domain-containing protein [Citrobacter freundii]|uniref:DUF551 domain-containing protein n=1 Tax=Citrobacter freundii TaxID=546 RepID=UPI0034DCF741